MKKKLMLFSLCASFLFSIEKMEKTEEMIVNDPLLPTVAIVTTGGTIAEKTDPKTNSSVPALSGRDLIDSVPLLKKIANFKVINFCNIDSSQMTPEIWSDLSRVVDLVLEDRKIKGAVVTHGTDTMVEGAYFLDLTLKSSKPVVFVGAMKNASDPYSDGPPNLLNAVFQVCSRKDLDWGVTVTMNQYINSPREVEKMQTTNIQTFESGESGYLGYIHEGNVYKLNNRLYKQKLPLPEKLPNVVLFTDFSGSDGSYIYMAVDKLKVDGIIIESLGAGNVNAPVFDAIKYAISKNVVIVITSRVIFGSVFPEYGDKGGGKMLQAAGAIMAGNLKGPKARLLLMLALPFVKNDLYKLEKYFAIPK